MNLDDERADSIFKAYLKLIAPAFFIGMIFGALLTSLILLV